MKSLQRQIVWNVLILTLGLFLVASAVAAYIIEKKAETQVIGVLEYIRDSKFKSLTKDNLKTAFDFYNLNYTSYIIDETGRLLEPTNYIVDSEIIEFCKTNDAITDSYTKNNITKYVSIKKNGNLCLVIEGNTNNSVLLGQFTQEVFYGLLVSLALILYLLLRYSYKKILNPVQKISENTENALVSKWESVSPAKTKISELQNLDKYSNYLIELLKQKGGGDNSAKLEEIKQFQGKFLNKKIATDANKFKLAVDSALDMVIIVDKFGYINYVNGALTATTGITLSDAENKKITELWHRDDDVEVWKQNYEKVSKEKKSVVFSAWGYRTESIKFESEIKISPIKNPDDTVDNFLVIERDVTEEKQKERIKTEFISVVSHELRTPMTVIRGYSALLSDGKLGAINEKQKEYIDKINSETGRLLELANDMLDLQKFESGKIELKFEKTNMVKFMQKIVEDFQMQYAKKGFTLVLENNLKSENANIDVKYFERVITNLLTNAYKYTEKGGVKVFLVNPDPNNIVIAVKDTGVGIKEAALPHLFERFYQAQGVMQRKQEGSGLGLSIVKTVAEAHNGMVWVESKEGVGSTFYVAIPLAE
jgi:PAS domain S-box-containing protein